MRGMNLNPSRVYKTASRLLDSKASQQTPPWFTAIGKFPPGEILTRTQPVQHSPSKLKSRTRKPSKMFKPQRIEYEEDGLRKDFYSDHPWELARPRIVLEDDGRDGRNWNWSKIQQRGRPLDGESVVQRQLWLLYNAPGMTKSQAYDIARKEFYDLRQEEEIERRVAREEALWNGAYFGKSALKAGMELEDAAYDGWTEWAQLQVEALSRQRDGAYTGVGTSEHEETTEDPATATVEESTPTST